MGPKVVVNFYRDGLLGVAIEDGEGFGADLMANKEE